MGLLMKRLLGILTTIMLLIAMAIGAAAHASETICLPDVEASATFIHADGDADQSGDADQGVPHHHGGCHGHHLAVPVGADAPADVIATSEDRSGTGSTLAALAAPGTALRPPIA